MNLKTLGRRRPPIALPAAATVEPEALKSRIVATLEDDKAEDIVVIPLTGRSALADFMVIATGRSTRQVAAMADHVDQATVKLGLKAPRIEGKSEANWVVVDTGDVIVHLFRPEVRGFYNLEKMWLVDAPAEPASPPPAPE